MGTIWGIGDNLGDNICENFEENFRDNFRGNNFFFCVLVQPKTHMYLKIYYDLRRKAW